jgi:hypothetical protein
MGSGAAGCIIPIKGANRRLPGKHFRHIAGKTMLEWGIRAPLDAGLPVLVYADEEVFYDMARGLGAMAVLRPPELSEAGVEVPAVIARCLVDNVQDWDTVIVHQSTAPFVQPSTFLAMQWLHMDSGADVVGAVEPNWSGQAFVGPGAAVSGYCSPWVLKRSFALTGADYTNEDMVPYTLTDVETVNIDSPADLAHARAEAQGLHV